MNHSLNDAQLLVLRWVAAGADLQDPPIDTFKISAVALHTRGFVNLDKRRGRWSIEITDAGKFYLEHGFHPKARPPKPAPKAKPAASTPSPKRTHKAAVASAAPAEPVNASDSKAEPTQTLQRETVPVPEQLRRPHKAVKEIVDHKARLDVPAEQHSMALQGTPHSARPRSRGHSPGLGGHPEPVYIRGRPVEWSPEAGLSRP